MEKQHSSSQVTMKHNKKKISVEILCGQNEVDD